MLDDGSERRHEKMLYNQYIAEKCKAAAFGKPLAKKAEKMAPA